MKTTKLFFMAALALMTAACSNDDNDLTTQQPQKAEGITITAQLAPKTGGATTRAVADNGDNKITVTWAENEHIAVLYTKDENKYVADATITAVDGSGTATITFDVEAGTPDNTTCTLVYPYSAAKDDHSGVKDAATLLAAQDGTLSANLDVRVGEGTIQTTTPGLTVTTQPEAQFAIFKFTTKNSGGTATIDVNSLTITIGAQDYVITPASATSELYVALPAVSGQTVSFSATDSESKTYTCSKDGVTFAAGKYYQSPLKMEQAYAANQYNEASWDGTKVTFTKQTAASVTAVANSDAAVTWSDGWYTVSGNVTITGNVTLGADAHLILQDGATLTINGELNCRANSKNLYIYGQEKGDGKLNVNNNATAIRSKVGYRIDIHGGEVTATAGTGLSTGYLAVYGGKLTATSSGGDGIFFNNTFDVYDGEVEATSNATSGLKTCYGIKSSSGTASQILTVYGGKVTATGNGIEDMDFGDYGSGFGCYVWSGTSGIKFYFSADGTTWGEGTSYASATSAGRSSSASATQKRYAKAE